MGTIRHILLCALIILLYSNRGFGDENELQALKTTLFGSIAAPAELPVLADPPTGDYNDLAKGNFAFRIDQERLRLIARYGKELEPLIVARIEEDYGWLYLSAFLRYESAVPIIKKKLLENQSIYGWEGPDYSKMYTYLTDAQYPYQMACINAIEYITGKPVSQSIRLTNKERHDLNARAKKCTSTNIDTADFARYCSARWLLGKLKPSSKNTRKIKSKAYATPSPK
ncbi:MAG TPA: hypothetical protein VN371_07300 [Chlorobaculum sp.]|nr:hypothetical protein [Chlorobaculum sp.]